jgi:hypothetical protein
MAKPVHHDNGRRTDCFLLKEQVKVTKLWHKVTCSACKKMNDDSWRGMSG